jgi:ATP-dependent RNA helicase DDX3X
MRRKQTKSRLAEPLIVVLVPNRELAIQIFDEARRLCYRTGLRPCVAYGGSDMAMNLNQLAEGCDVLIATPGRLTDLMKKPDVLTMSRVKYARTRDFLVSRSANPACRRYTIIDEADELLTSDWEEEFSMIMAGGGMVFSRSPYRNSSDLS